jgi:hypothetical protein
MLANLNTTEKQLPGTNALAYFGRSVSDEDEKVYSFDTKSARMPLAIFKSFKTGKKLNFSFRYYTQIGY